MGTGHHHLSKIYINTLSCVKSTPLQDYQFFVAGAGTNFPQMVSRSSTYSISNCPFSKELFYMIKIKIW